MVSLAELSPPKLPSHAPAAGKRRIFLALRKLPDFDSNLWPHPPPREQPNLRMTECANLALNELHTTKICLSEEARTAFGVFHFSQQAFCESTGLKSGTSWCLKYPRLRDTRTNVM